MKALQLVTTPRPFFDDQLAALERHGVECTTVTVPGDRGDRTPVDLLRFVRRVRRVADDSYDVVHANFGLTGPAALVQPVRPVVLTLWGTDVMGDHRAVRTLSRLSARRADAVVFPSRRLTDYLDCPHHLVQFGVDTELFRPIPRDAARATLGWDPEQPVVLFPYDPDRAVKNYPRAMDVVDRLAADADLRVVSGVPHEQVPTYMNASDAVLITSRRESGPLVVKEAAACNVPVVSTDVGFVRNVLGPVDASAVRETDAGLAAALDRVLADRRRSDGRRSAPELKADELGARLSDLYESLAVEGSA